MRIYFFYVLVVVASISALSCKKREHINNSKNLLSGYKDSLSRYNVTYTNGRINTLLRNGVFYYSFEYKDNYVKASEQQAYIEYFLNNSGLPLRIIRKYGVSNVDETHFYYKTGTNILDSVVSNNSYDWLAIYDKYSFLYNGGNIEQVIKSSFYRNGTVSKDTFSYTYNPTPNIFRHTDPLLYIYVNPGFAMYYFQNLLFYFPKVFSAATFNTYSFPEGTRRRHGKLNYILNSKGKITKEWYDGWGHPYEYYYN
ncbi:MAG: hypothetical protein M3342_16760 [Bacteroidota bacterium]|nr:hypothetical protein [Bacteroidota bacterium]